MRSWRLVGLDAMRDVRVIDLYGRAFGLDVRAVNASKLLFGGQFTFLARRAD